MPHPAPCLVLLTPGCIVLARPRFPQLVAFIGVRAVGCVCADGVPLEDVNIWPEDGWLGVLQATPIYICAFGCHFNVLPVHGELAKPTRERLHRMVMRRLAVLTGLSL